MPPMEAKAITATAVAPNRGMAFWLTTSLAASRPLRPWSIFIFMPSTMTMALSTSMPRAMIKAPREMRSRVIW